MCLAVCYILWPFCDRKSSGCVAGLCYQYDRSITIAVWLGAHTDQQKDEAPMTVTTSCQKAGNRMSGLHPILREVKHCLKPIRATVETLVVIYRYGGVVTCFCK